VPEDNVDKDAPTIVPKPKHYFNATHTDEIVNQQAEHVPARGGLPHRATLLSIFQGHRRVGLPSHRPFPDFNVGICRATTLELATTMPADEDPIGNGIWERRSQGEDQPQMRGCTRFDGHVGQEAPHFETLSRHWFYPVISRMT